MGNKRRKHFGATKPFEKICVDITGPLPDSDGYSYILGIIDVFSRYAMLIPLKKITSVVVAEKIMTRWISYFGVADVLHSNNGTQFNAEIMQQFCRYFGLKQTFSAPYYHQGNSIIERLFRVAKDMIYSVCKTNNQSWVKSIPFVEMALRGKRHRSLGFSPYEILFGDKMPNNPFLKFGYAELDEQHLGSYVKEIREKLNQIRDFLPKEDGLAGNFDHPMKLRQTVMVKSERQGILEKRFFGPCKVVNVLPYDNILVEYEGKFFSAKYIADKAISRRGSDQQGFNINSIGFKMQQIRRLTKKGKRQKSPKKGRK